MLTQKLGAQIMDLSFIITPVLHKCIRLLSLRYFVKTFIKWNGIAVGLSDVFLQAYLWHMVQGQNTSDTLLLFHHMRIFGQFHYLGTSGKTMSPYLNRTWKNIWKGPLNHPASLTLWFCCLSASFWILGCGRLIDEISHASSTALTWHDLLVSLPLAWILTAEMPTLPSSKAFLHILQSARCTLSVNMSYPVPELRIYLPFLLKCTPPWHDSALPHVHN